MRKKIVMMAQFEELSADKKVQAIDKYRDINIHDDWYEDTIAKFKTEMEDKGFEIPKNGVKFELHSQGSGACFEATVYLSRFLKAHGTPASFPRVLNEWKKGAIAIKVTQTGRYCHPYSMDVEITHNMDENSEKDEVEDVIDTALEGGKEIVDAICELNDWIKDKAREYANNLYGILDKEYDYWTSDEAVADSIKANKIEFEVA